MKYDSHVELYKSYMIVDLIYRLYGRKVKTLSFKFH